MIDLQVIRATKAHMSAVSTAVHAGRAFGIFTNFSDRQNRIEENWNVIDPSVQHRTAAYTVWDSERSIDNIRRESTR